MYPQEIIIKKRNGNELTFDEINYFVKEVISGAISSNQATAFLMSCFINGLSAKEITSLTNSMTNNGFKFDFSNFNKKRIDKHSTGGIGDKVSLILLPILLDLGIAVPMISGRGLGHTGGTLDKLESIIGLKTIFKEDEIYSLMDKNNGFIVSQTQNIAPADRIFYALRDECGIVDSIGLIVSSILSKKLAEDLDALVMDIKVGNGAFMSNLDEALKLGDRFFDYSKTANFPMTIIYSEMNEPLGRKSGNWLEIEESIDFLNGKIEDERLKAVVYENIIQCLLLSDKNLTYDKAISLIEDSINSGRAYNKFISVIEAQGGDLQKSVEFYSQSKEYNYYAMKDGYINFDTKLIGIANYLLAYKSQTNGQIDYSAGFIFNKYSQDWVNKGDFILKIKYMAGGNLDEVLNYLYQAIIYKDINLEKANPIIQVFQSNF